MSTSNNSNHDSLPGGQEGTTGNNRGLNESGEGIDKDVNDLQNSEVPKSNPQQNPGSGRQSNGEGDGGSSSQSNAKGSSGDGGYGSMAAGIKGAGGDSVKGATRNASEKTNTGNSDASEEKSGGDASGKDGAVAGNS